MHEVRSDSAPNRYIFLFSNLLIVTKLKKSLFKGKDATPVFSYLYEVPLNEDVQLFNVDDTEGKNYFKK